tara:strand:+ start:236 stop:463 length:228 start_codon:yes stop_codon:yes gene_type:complete
VLEAQAINKATRNIKNRSAWIVDACIEKSKRIDKSQDALDAASVYDLLSTLQFKGAIDHEMRWMLQDRWEQRQNA